MYSAVFALRLAVYFLTGVMALLAETLHTLTGIFVSGFLLAATEPADVRHAHPSFGLRHLLFQDRP